MQVFSNFSHAAQTGLVHGVSLGVGGLEDPVNASRMINSSGNVTGGVKKKRHAHVCHSAARTSS